MTAKNQFRIALYFFVAIALLGLILRTIPVYDLGINFTNFLHAHSHVAFLGWLHSAFISFVSCYFYLALSIYGPFSQKCTSNGKEFFSSLFIFYFEKSICIY